MKFIVKLFVLALFLNATTAEAQFFKKLAKKVGDRIEKSVSDKIEDKSVKTTEDAVDGVLDGDASKKNKRKKRRSSKNKNQNTTSDEAAFDPSGMLEGLMGGEVVTEDAYTFNITSTMKMTSSENKKPTTFKQGYGTEGLLMEMPGTTSKMIMDIENQSMIMIDQEAMTAQLMSLGFMDKMGMGDIAIDTDTASTDTAPTFTKTGKTKTINGYRCEEYEVTQDTLEMSIWYTSEVDFNYQDYLRGFAKMFSGTGGANPSGLMNDGYGYMMMMTSKDNKSGDTMTMEVIELSEVPQTFTLKDYKIQKLF